MQPNEQLQPSRGWAGIQAAGTALGRAVGAAGLVALGVVIARQGMTPPGAEKPGPAAALPAATLVSAPASAPEVAPADPAVFVVAGTAAPAVGLPEDAPLAAPLPEALPPTLTEASAPPVLAVADEPAEAATAPAPGPPEAPEPPAPAEPAGLDLAMVPDDAALVVAARPAALLARPELRSMYDLATRSQPELRRYVELANLPGVEQVTVVVARHGISLVGLQEGAALYTATGLIVRTSAPRDWKATIAAVAPGLPFDESRYAGRTYTRITLGESGMSIGLYTPDDRTAVVAGLPNLFGFMAAQDRPANQAWADAWEALDGAEAAVAVDVGTVRGQLEPFLVEMPHIVAAAGVLSPLWEETSGLVVGVRLSGGLAFELATTSPNEAQGESVARTLEAVLTLARNSGRASKGVLDRLGQQAGGEAAILVTVADVANRLLDATRVERQGTVVRLRTSTDQDLIKRAAQPWIKVGATY